MAMTTLTRATAVAGTVGIVALASRAAQTDTQDALARRKDDHNFLRTLGMATAGGAAALGVALLMRPTPAALLKAAGAGAIAGAALSGVAGTAFNPILRD